jgi:putative FmdB family regulatory protein
MPIYEYRCPQGHLFEVFHGMNDPAPAVCEICGEGPLERVLHPIAVHFKGSGFYTTDYGRGSKKAKKDGGGKDEGGGSKETGSTPSSDTKSTAAEA